MAVPTAPLFTSSTPPVIDPAPLAEKLPTRAKNPPVSCPVIVKAYEPLRLATLYGPVVGGGAGVVHIHDAARRLYRDVGSQRAGLGIRSETGNRADQVRFLRRIVARSQIIRWLLRASRRSTQ